MPLHPHRESAENLLQQHFGTELSGLVSAVECADIGATIQLVGSLAEGLATRDSDIDLLVVADSEPKTVWCGSGEFGTDGLVFGNGGAEINVTYWNRDYMLESCRRLRSAVEAFLKSSTSRFGIFEDFELMRLHQLRTGISLKGDEQIQGWIREFELDGLRVYHIFYGMGLYASWREDACAQYREGDLDSAAHMIRISAEALARVLLGAVGETNIKRKWVPRLLNRYSDAIGKGRVEQALRLLALSSDEMADAALAGLDELALGAVGLVIQTSPDVGQALVASAQRTPMRRFGTN